MSGKFLGVGGNNNGVAQEFKADSEGNQSTLLSKRNEVATWGTHTIAGNNATKSVILRFKNLKNYSALVFALNADKSAKFNIIVNWYMQESGGKQVAREQIVTDVTASYFSSNYLEMKGNEISVIIVNRGTEETTFDAYLMGIR